MLLQGLRLKRLAVLDEGSDLHPHAQSVAKLLCVDTGGWLDGVSFMTMWIDQGHG